MPCSSCLEGWTNTHPQNKNATSGERGGVCYPCMGGERQTFSVLSGGESARPLVFCLGGEHQTFRFCLAGRAPDRQLTNCYAHENAFNVPLIMPQIISQNGQFSTISYCWHIPLPHKKNALCIKLRGRFKYARVPGIYRKEKTCNGAGFTKAFSQACF